MTEEMIRDLSEAVRRLQAAFAKHGLEQPLAIALGSIDDFHAMRSSPLPSSMFHQMSDPNALHKDVAFKLNGLSFVHPLSVREAE